MNDYVSVDVRPRRVGTVSKFNPSYVGPYQIDSVIGDDVYWVKDPLKPKRRTKVNGKWLRKYNLESGSKIEDVKRFEWYDIFSVTAVMEKLDQLYPEQKRKRSKPKPAQSQIELDLDVNGRNDNHNHNNNQ
jgi:hypothetical protein